MQQTQGGPQERDRKWAAPRFGNWQGFLDDWRVHGPRAALPDRPRCLGRRSNQEDAIIDIFGRWRHAQAR